MKAEKLDSGSAEQRLALRYLQSFPLSAARVIERQPTDRVVELLGRLGHQRAIALVGDLMPYYVARLCSQAPLELAVKWLAPMATRRLTMILRFMNKPRRSEILKALPVQVAAACRVFLNYPEDTVGAWMSDLFMVLPDNVSVGEALLRLQEPGYLLNSDAIPVVDSNHELQGIVSHISLYSAAQAIPVSEVMDRDSPVLSARSSLAAARQHPGWSRYETLPVLNRERQLVGVMRHVHLRDSQENREQVARHVISASRSMLGNLGASYLQILGTGFGWLGEAMNEAPQQQPDKQP